VGECSRAIQITNVEQAGDRREHVFQRDQASVNCSIASDYKVLHARDRPGAAAFACGFGPIGALPCLVYFTTTANFDEANRDRGRRLRSFVFLPRIRLFAERNIARWHKIACLRAAFDSRRLH
jgi:hypothetical protein